MSNEELKEKIIKVFQSAAIGELEMTSREEILK